MLRWHYRPHHDDSLETYDAEGRLKTIKARNDHVTTLVYSSASTPVSHAPYAGLLLAVRNAFGRELRLSYDSALFFNLARKRAYARQSGSKEKITTVHEKFLG